MLSSSVICEAIFSMRSGQIRKGHHDLLRSGQRIGIKLHGAAKLEEAHGGGG